MEYTLQTRMKRGEKLSIEARTQRIYELREMIQKGYTSISAIAEHFNVTLDTASQWRKAALTLIERDNEGFDRRTIKHMQVGRLQVQIESLQDDLKKTTDIKERMMIHQRINAYYDTLHRITGLNTETLQIEHQLKPLQINMPTIIDAEATTSTPQALTDKANSSQADWIARPGGQIGATP